MKDVLDEILDLESGATPIYKEVKLQVTEVVFPKYEGPQASEVRSIDPKSHLEFVEARRKRLRVG